MRTSSPHILVNKKLLHQVSQKLDRLKKLEKVAKAATKLMACTGLRKCKCEVNLHAALIELEGSKGR
jgi:hypothetical protein